MSLTFLIGKEFDHASQSVFEHCVLLLEDSHRLFFIPNLRVGSYDDAHAFASGKMVFPSHGQSGHSSA